MDQLIFEQKYQLYSEMLYKIAFVYFGNSSDAEEMVQETFIKLCYHAPKFENSAHEKAWLIRVISNLCKNQLKTAWKKQVETREDMSEYLQDSRDSELLELVIALPTKLKAPIYLYYYEGYSVLEISNILKLSQSAVKMRLKRARQKLKLELEKPQ